MWCFDIKKKMIIDLKVFLWLINLCSWNGPEVNCIVMHDIPGEIVYDIMWWCAATMHGTIYQDIARMS